MRRFALPLALVLGVAGAAPVLAGAGLPKLASLQPGPYRATLHNDSHTLVAGRNTLTVEIARLPEQHQVFLTLVGPAGLQLDVPLRPVLRLDDPDGHGTADTHASADAHAESDDHATTDSHSVPATNGRPDADGKADAHPVATDSHAAQPSGSAPGTAPSGSATHGHDTTPASAEAHANEARVPSTDANGQDAVPAVVTAAHEAASDDSHGHPDVAASEHAEELAVSDHHDAPGAADHHGAAGFGEHQDALPTTGSFGTTWHTHEGGATFLGRGTVDVPLTGTWSAVLMIRDGPEVLLDEVLLEARENGPNGLYIAATGATIAGFLLYGAVQRRRQPTTRRAGR
jgi:hypothetical protein